MRRKPKVIGIRVENGVTIHRYEARPARGSNAIGKWAAARGGPRKGAISDAEARIRLPSILLQP